MKIGNIVEPNSKGQIVIPKKIREALGITMETSLNIILRGEGIYIYPVGEVIPKLEGESAYTELLRKTQGAWSKDEWTSFKRRRAKERRITRRNRKEW